MHEPTMHIRKQYKGAAGGHTWTHDGAVVEVPETLGMELLTIPNGGFTPHDPSQVAEMPAPEDLPVELAAYVQGLVERHVGDQAAEAVGALTAELVQLLERKLSDLRDVLVADVIALADERADKAQAQIDALRTYVEHVASLTVAGTAAPATVGPAGASSDPVDATVAEGAEVPAGVRRRDGKR